MRQVSLITLYGPKPLGLNNLIAEFQSRLSAILDIKFRPYDVQQIHGTIVGLERTGKSNLNFAKFRNHFDHMDFDGVLTSLKTEVVPLQIQLGGFTNQDYPFTSRGKRPYERSFVIQNENVVLIGWPIRGQPLVVPSKEPIGLGEESRSYPNSLDNLRRSLQRYNILHSYHREPGDVDNDYYFRIGVIDSSSVDQHVVEELETSLRAYLGSWPPLIVEISQRDLYFASYEDSSLPLTSTSVWPVRSNDLTGNFIWTLFD